MTIFQKTIESINEEYSGIDLQEKLRNFIIDIYDSENIDYLTLGADIQDIPYRAVFAFDCQYGLLVGENEIPSDMYYSCLNGSWDDNQNGIYGEDDDNIDYIPEIYLSRITAKNSAEVSSYVNRLLNYEKGEIANYEKASGFCMELWEGANSKVCQQYIYDQFFPEFFAIDFLWGENSNQQNAYNSLNENQNLVQHTGHAGYRALSLESGSIKLTNIENLNNNWGGLIYSIGCWSSALDYETIAEKLLIPDSGGFLGFIGNSRYGWGAPAAPGFGFSEFYQKEFFKNFFEENITILSQANTLQKLPFVPFYQGVSVYKWVAYELNAIGDSYFNLFNENPKEFSTDIFAVNDSIYFQIYDNELPVEGAVISIGLDYQGETDENGIVFFAIDSTIEDELTVYKNGYRVYEDDNFNSDNYIQPFIRDAENQNSFYKQGDEISILSSLSNPTSNPFSFSIEFEYNGELLNLQADNEVYEILAGEEITLPSINGEIFAPSVSYQLSNNDLISFNMKIIDSNSDEMITNKIFPLKIQAPEISLTMISLDYETLLNRDNNVEFSLLLKNISAVNIENFSGILSTNNECFLLSQNIITETNFNPNDSIQIDLTASFNEQTPDDFIGVISLDMEAISEDVPYSFSKQILIPNENAEYNNDFESPLNWASAPEWQLVDNYANSGNFSLSCRPEFSGTYSIESPSFIYLPEMEFSFMYKYKMPMYGNDGVFFLLEHNAEIDTLLFLGAGGALPEEHSRVIETYIEGDWIEFSLTLQDLILSNIQIGESFNLKLVFNFAEIFPDFNEYFSMDDIGIFIDDFTISAPQLIVENGNISIESESILCISPNPMKISSGTNFSFFIDNFSDIELEIYNIKGQLISEKTLKNRNKGQQTIYWNGRNFQGKSVASGVYFAKIHSKNKSLTAKFLILK